METDLLNMKRLHDKLQYEHNTLSKEKQTLLDYIEELNHKHLQKMGELEQEMHTISDINKKLQRQIDELQMQIIKKTDETNMLKHEKEGLIYASNQSEKDIASMRDEIYALKTKLQ